MRIETPHARGHLVACLAAFGWAAVASAQPSSTERARDRGPGLPTSMFATYIERGELIVYPFFEHYRDRNLEYRPAEFGYRGEGEYRGRYRANEALLFLGYGLTDNVALEFEASTIRAALDRDPQDVSDMPPRIVESGIGDIEGQLRWRWKSETSTRPELFSYAELVVPHHGRKHLIGTPGTQVKAGMGTDWAPEVGVVLTRRRR